MDETGSERRVDDLGREAFDRAVAVAATQATQAVAQIHRRRLVAQTAVATFLVCAGMALLVGFVFKGAADQQAHAFAVENCQLVRALSLPLSQFVQSDATLRKQQAKLSASGQLGRQISQKFAHLLGARVYAKALARSAQLNAETVNYWENVVVPELRGIAGTNCQLRLG